MLMDLITSGLERTPRSILHIGANRGGEAPLYAAEGIAGYHVEAIPEIFAQLRDRCAALAGQHAIQACLHQDRRLVRFNVSSNFASSSVLDLGRHAVAYPDVTYRQVIEIWTETADDLVARGAVPRDVECAVLDVQGAELHVLRGATGLLRAPDLLALVIEVSADPLYDGGATYLEICRYLEGFGFYTRQVTFNEDGWGDALFTRRSWKLADSEVPPLYRHYDLRPKGRNIAVEGECTQSSDTMAGAARNAGVLGPRGPGAAFVTRVEPRAWWQVDLLQVRPFDEIVIFNRIDAGRDLASAIELVISEDGVVWTSVWVNEYAFGGVDGRPLRVEIPGRHARFLRVLGSPDSCLHLNRVEIYDRQAG